MFIGGVKATVTAASANQLTVTVPGGATNGLISVSVAGRVGYSGKSFLPVYTGSGFITPLSFAVRTDSTSSTTPSGLTLADMDTDGKTDLVISNSGSSNPPATNRNLTIYRNGSSTGNISFIPRTVLSNGTSGLNVHKVTHADFNGDGKLDILASKPGDLFAAAVFTNNSIAGSLAFGTEIQLSSSLGKFRAVPGDFDGDGRPDVAMIGNLTGGVQLFRNTGSGATVSFGTAQTVTGGNLPAGITTADLDLDGKTDIVVSGGSGGFLNVLRNTSTGSPFSFVNHSLYTFSPLGEVMIADMDGDGLEEIVCVSSYANVVYIYKNTSQPGYIQFEPARILSAGNGPSGLCIADVDGNSKPDLIISSEYVNRLMILSNTSVPGTIAFREMVQVPVNSPAVFAASGDVDGDGKPEIVLANPQSNSVSVLRNLHNAISLSILPYCANGTVQMIADLTGSTYQWQQNTGTGFFNISDNAVFTGTTTATLQLNNIPASWNNNEFRCFVNGNQYSKYFRLNVLTPGVSISGATTVTGGQSTTISTAIQNGGPSPQYQWQDSTGTHNWQNISGATAGSVQYTPVQTGDKLRCVLNSNICSPPSAATSNALSFIVNTATGLNPVNAAQYHLRYFPNPVHHTLYIDSLRPADQWQTISFTGTGGKQVMPAISIRNRTTIAVDVSQLPAAVYVAVLRRKNGEIVYLKFVKQ